MTLIEFLNHLLQEERKQGATNKQMADRAGISQQHMNFILNGKRDLGGMSFEVMMRLFPKLERILIENLHVGDEHSHTITGNGNIVANHNFTATVNNAPLPPDFGEIMPEIMASDMCDACKVKAYNIIHDRIK